MRIDLNCDLGEGCPYDAELMPLITSANIACGAHAGDPATIAATLRCARAENVQVGAHPSFPDRQNFGRVEMSYDPEQIALDCLYQVGALNALAYAAGVPVRYLKPHGALYNLACRERAIAKPVVQTAKLFGLAVMGLPDSALAEEAKAADLPFVAEGFADRRYRHDGSLVPRTASNAFVNDHKEAAIQADWLIRSRGVQTICVHGDNPLALEFLRHLRDSLREWGFEVRPFELPDV